MIITRLKIDGMSCRMCESHLNDTIRNNFSVKKVKSSYKKGEIEIISEEELSKELLFSKINETGYKVLEVSNE